MVRVQGALLAQESGFSTACRRMQSGEGGYTGQRGCGEPGRQGGAEWRRVFCHCGVCFVWVISPPSQWHVLIPQFLH